MMPATIERQDRLPPRAARRAWHRTALAAFVFVLSSMVFWAQPASAAGEGLVVGATLGEAASEATAVAAEGAACGPVCLGVTTAVGLGLFAWQTKDIWMPWVNNMIGNDGTSKQAGTADCYSDGGGSGTWNSTGAVFTLSVNGGGCGGMHASVDSEVCSNGSNGGGYREWSGGYAVNNTWTLNAYDSWCGTGAKLTQFRAYAVGAHNNALAYYTFSRGVGGWAASANTQTTTVHCKNVLTGGAQDVTVTTTGDPSGYLVPSCEARLGTPWHSTGAVVSVGPSVSQQPHSVTVTDRTTTDYPDCFDTTTGAMKCVVRVWVGGQPCQVGNVACVDWQQYARDNPDQSVQCQMGSHVLPLSDCSALKWAYRSDLTSSQRTPTTDPATGTTTVPTGATAQPSPASAMPTTGTSPQSKDTPATSPAPKPGSNSCWSGVQWSWDPYYWTLLPVECAFQWAFVPDPATWGWQAVETQFQSRPPYSVVAGLADTINGMVAGYKNAGDCGIIADFSDQSNPNLKVTCSQVEAVQGHSTLYALVQVALVGFTGWGVFWLFARALGSGGSSS